jgi:hypothetical protein
VLADAITRAQANEWIARAIIDVIEALERIFPGGAPRPDPAAQTEAAPAPPGAGGTGQPPVEVSADAGALLAQARDHYQRALKAQRDGNWALYGEEIKKLGELLERIKK